MKNGLIPTVFILFVLFILTSQSFAADYSIGIEIKPLPVITSLASGISSGELEGQYSILQNSELVFDIYFLNMNLSDELYEKHKKIDEYNLSIRKINSYSPAIGYRWYSSRSTSSFFIGMFIGYDNNNILYLYKDTEKLDVKNNPYWVKINLGYRWLWDNGINLRLGLNGTITPYAKSTITAKEQTEQTEEAIDAAETKLNDKENRKTIISASLDLGIGIVF